MPLKRIILVLILLLNIQISAFGVEVNNYDELIENLSVPEGDSEIQLNSDMEANCAIGCPAKKSVTLNGQGHTINGCGCSGFILEENQSMNLTDITVKDFHSKKGGVVNNSSGCHIDTLNGNFIENSSEEDGGVILNSSNIAEVKGEFNNNSAYNNGGAIYNDGTINSLSGSFNNNSTEKSTGGAICNFGNIKETNAYFKGNQSHEGIGGAIYNFSNMGKIESNFEDNSAAAGGGAIMNLGSIDSIKGDFRGNYTTESGDYIGGGAIMNYGSINKLSGNFENNTSQGRGGAIYNFGGTVKLTSDEQEITFSGNTDMTGSNAIHNDNGTVYLNAGAYDITVNDKISGGNTSYYKNSNININQNGSGNVILTNEVSGNAINMYGGVLKPIQNSDGTSYGNFDNTVDFNYYGGTVDLRDDSIHNTNFGNLTLYKNMDLKLDGSFEEPTVDTFSADSFNSNGFNIDISDIKLMTTTDVKRFTVAPISDETEQSVYELLKDSIIYTAGDVVNSPVYKYHTYYDKENGLIVFERLEGVDIYNPAIYVSQVAAQLGGYLTQLNSYEEAFRKMDMYMLLTNKQRLSLKFRNRYAATNMVLTSQIEQIDNKCAWFRPYTILERVPLKRGVRVSNVAYGSFFGLESDVITLKRNWNLIWGPYFAYNGSHQAFNGNSIYQNGGTIGAVSMAYKNNFFTGLTANVSSNGCEANTMYGSENFGMFMTGVASKTGYNWELNEGQFIIQPNYLMSYTLVNTFNYKNAANVYIDPKPLQAMQIAPGVQIFGNLKNHWQPYINAYFVWNIADKAKIKANDITIPALSVKPFVLYGAGVRKIWSERFSGFTQTYVTHGGRNGVGINFALRVKVGK